MSIKESLEKYLSNYERGYYNTGAIRWLHKNDPILWDMIVSETSFLPEDAKPKQRCWHILNDTYEILYEPDTGKPRRWQGSHYYVFSGQGSHMKNKDVVQKKKNKFRNTYGVDNPMKVEKFKNNLKETCMKKYGVPNYFLCDEGKQKVAAAWQDEDKRARRLAAIKKTFDKKFGGYPYQNPDILEKALHNGKKYRSFELPSGKIIKIQGYEDKAILELLESYEEKDIITSKKFVPKINYYFEGKNRVYYPDIYIPKENKIYEVKSTYTYKADLEKNEVKREACIAQGFSFEFKIYEST